MQLIDFFKNVIEKASNMIIIIQKNVKSGLLQLEITHRHRQKCYKSASPPPLMRQFTSKPLGITFCKFII